MEQSTERKHAPFRALTCQLFANGLYSSHVYNIAIYIIIYHNYYIVVWEYLEAQNPQKQCYPRKVDSIIVILSPNSQISAVPARILQIHNAECFVRHVYGVARCLWANTPLPTVKTENWKTMWTKGENRLHIFHYFSVCVAHPRSCTALCTANSLNLGCWLLADGKQIGKQFPSYGSFTMISMVFDDFCISTHHFWSRWKPVVVHPDSHPR